MFEWLRRKPGERRVLYFRSNSAAFEYAVEFVRRPLVKDSVIFGQVLGPAPESFEQKLLKTAKLWRVKLATEHGVVEAKQCGAIHMDIAGQTGGKTSPLATGDLVAVQVGAYDPRYAIDSPLQYFVVVVKLKPELIVEKNVFSPDIGY